MPNANSYQQPNEATGKERVFQPSPPESPRNAILLFSAFFLVVLIFSPDMVSRLIFILFAGLFLGFFLIFIRWDARKERHPLRFSPAGLHHPPLAATYGVESIPWPEIRELDLFHNAGGSGRLPPWLRIHLHDGPFRRQISTPASERLFGGDINLLLDFEERPESILAEARTFQARHAAHH